MRWLAGALGLGEAEGGAYAHGRAAMRPRRAWCVGCESTHVRLAASCVPLRRDSAEVIGSALRAAALGAGHRRIAADLGRPAATVRGWLCRAHARKDAIRASATRWAYALGRVHPAHSRLGDAVEALALVARAWALGRCVRAVVVELRGRVRR